MIYAFPASDFEASGAEYPYARQFVEAYETVTADYQWAKDARDPQRMFLHDVVRRRPLESCSSTTTIRDAARSLLITGSDALAVVDAANRVDAVMTVNSVLAWVARGAGDAGQPVGAVVRDAPPAIESAASVTDAVLAMCQADADALTITSDGSSSGELQALVTPRDFARGLRR